MAKSTKLEGVGNLSIYVDSEGQGLRFGPQSRRTVEPKEALESMTKGERRRVRKALHRHGFAGMAKASL